MTNTHSVRYMTGIGVLAAMLFAALTGPVSAYTYNYNNFGTYDAPTCALWTTDASINEAEGSEIVWTTGDAEYVYINEGIGEVQDHGSQEVWPDETTTYTLTAYGYNGQSVQCSTTVSVSYVDNQNDHCDARPWYDPRGWYNCRDYRYPIGYNQYTYNNYATPSCTISISGYQYQPGYVYNQTATLQWRSYNATSAYITNVGSVGVNGAQAVYPQQYQNYVLTVSGPGGTATCSTTGEVTYPNSYYPTQYGAQYPTYGTGYPQGYVGTPYITLTQIPYTGLDLGFGGSILYWASLMLLAVAGGYLIVYFNGGMLHASFAQEVKTAARNQLRTLRSLIARD